MCQAAYFLLFLPGLSFLGRNALDRSPEELESAREREVSGQLLCFFIWGMVALALKVLL